MARALVNNPDVLIADEPTGNLDPDTSWDIMNLLDDINKRGNYCCCCNTYARFGRFYEKKGNSVGKWQSGQG